MAVEPPGERAEPEDGAMQKRETLSERVVTRDVRDFVSEDGVELGVVPFTPVGGQKNSGAQHAHGERDGNEFGLGWLGNSDESCGARMVREFGGEARVVNGLRCQP